MTRMTDPTDSESTLRPPRPRRRRGRRVVAILVALCVACFLLVNGCTGWLARSIVWGPNTDKPIDLADDPKPAALAALGVDHQLRVHVGPPPASLSVWVVEPSRNEGGPASPRGTVLVLHGITDRKDSMLGLGRQFAAGGYRAVLVDLRAHGRSGGRWLTFGVTESRDLAQVLDALAAADLLAGDVGVFGPSYGGGVAVQFAGIDPRVKAVVAVCPFASMRDVTPGVVRMYAPWPIRWLLLGSTIDRAVTEAGRIAGFDPDAASAVEAIRRTDAQVLLVHGRDDVKIPPSHSRRLHDAAPGHSRLLLLDGHGHDSVLAGDSGGVVLRESLDWFGRWLEGAEDAARTGAAPGQSVRSRRILSRRVRAGR